MVLNSQTPRHDSSSPYVSTYRLRKRRRNRRMLAGVLLIVVLGWIIYAVAMDPGDQTGDAREGRPANVEAPESSQPAGSSETAAPPDANPSASDPVVEPRPRPLPPPSKEKSSPALTESPADAGALPSVIQSTDQLVAAGKLVEARAKLNAELTGGRLSPADARRIRDAIAKINQTLVFSPRIVSADPFTEEHLVEPDEYLSRVAPENGVPWEFIARINDLDPRKMKPGARIKLIKGPFHAVVDKSDFRMDIYLGAPGGPRSMYIRSFAVGLGADNSTPLGQFSVTNRLSDPEWVNPRTGEKFASSDPKNPIGERWIGLQGVDDSTRQFKGYGVHGTIEPDSIGKQQSMGCVRLLADDVAMVFDMLKEGKSTVTIVP